MFLGFGVCIVDHVATQRRYPFAHILQTDRQTDKQTNGRRVST